MSWPWELLVRKGLLVGKELVTGGAFLMNVVVTGEGGGGGGGAGAETNPVDVNEFPGDEMEIGAAGAEG